MKKIFTTLALIAGISIGAFAQHCVGLDSVLITPGTGTVAGLHPSSDSLPCAVRGMMVSDTIYFTNFTSFSGFTVQSLTIDSIGNLPAGTCWASNKKNNTYAGGENGTIYVHGMNVAAPGQYKLGIFIHATAGAITLPPYTNAETIANLRYYVRVTCHDSICPQLDTVNGKTHMYIAYATCPNGINEVANDLSNVSVVPNPFTKTANVTFNSEVEGAFTVKLVNLLGAVVTTKEINVMHGSNEVTIERNSLSSGIYILTIANGSGAISRKVVIE